MGNETRTIDYRVTGDAQIANMEKTLLSIAKSSKITAQALEKLANKTGALAPKTKKLEKDTTQATNAMERFALATHKGKVDLKGLEANVYAASRGFSLMSQMIVREPVRALRLLSSNSKMAALGVTRLALASMALKEALAFVIASRFGVIMIMFAAIATLASGVRGAVNSFKELDEGTRKVMSAMSDAEKATNSYAETFLTIGYNTIKFGKSVEEVKTILWELNSAGLSASEAAAGLETNMRLLYTELDNVSLSTRMTSGLFMTFRNELMATRTEAEAFRYIGDVLAYVMNQSIVDADTLLQGYKHVLSTSNAMGLSFAETSAILAILNNEMIFAGMAGRGTRSAFSQLAQDLDKIVERYGIVVDTSKTMGSQVFLIFEQLNKKIGEGAISMEEFSFWMKTAGLRGAPTTLALIRNFKELNALVKTLEAPELVGFLKGISDVNMDTLNVQWSRFVNTAKVLGGIAFAPVGDALKDIFKDLADGGEEATEYVLTMRELDIAFTAMGVTQSNTLSNIINFWIEENVLSKISNDLLREKLELLVKLGLLPMAVVDRAATETTRFNLKDEAEETAKVFKSVREIKEVYELLQNMSKTEKIELFGEDFKEKANALRMAYEKTANMGIRSMDLDFIKAIQENLNKNPMYVSLRMEVDWTNLKEAEDKINRDFKRILGKDKGFDYEIKLAKGMLTKLDIEKELIGKQQDLLEAREKLIRLYGVKDTKKAYEEQKKNVIGLEKAILSLTKSQEKFNEASKVKAATDFMLKMGTMTEKEHLSILMEQREVLHGQMKELYALGGESDNYLAKLGEMRDLELKIAGIMRKQTEERGKLAEETAKMRTGLLAKGGDISVEGVKKRIHFLKIQKQLTDDPGALMEMNRAMIEFYSKIGDITGTDQLKNTMPLIREQSRLMEEAGKKADTSGKNIKEMMGGFYSLDNEVMKPVLEKVEKIAKAVADAGTAITAPGGMTEGFAGVKDLSSGIVYFIKEASTEIKKMKGDLDEISKMDMSNLGGGTGENTIDQDLKTGA